MADPQSIAEQHAQAERKNLRRAYLEVGSLIALPVAFVALIPSCAGLAVLRHQAGEIEAQTQRNRELALATKAIAEQGEVALEGLCTLRLDLERRIDSSNEFLRQNPEGIPGIRPEVIRRSLRDQQRTVDALAILDCKARGDPARN